MSKNLVPDSQTAMDPVQLKSMFVKWVLGRMRLVDNEKNRHAVNGFVFSTTDVLEWSHHLLRQGQKLN